MSLRPESAQWFELLTSREHLTSALECLAATGAVELQSHSEQTPGLAMPDLTSALEKYAQLSHEFSSYWPEPRLRALRVSATAPDSDRQFEKALARLAAWVEDAGPAIRQLQTATSERANLALLEMLYTQVADALPAADLLGGAGPVLESRLFLLPPGAWPEALPPTVITNRLQTKEHTILLAVGPVAEIGALATTIGTLKGRIVQVPADLPGNAEQARDTIRLRIADLDRRAGELRDELDASAARHELPVALGDLRRMQWYAEHVPQMPATERLAWITGWTSDEDGRRLTAALQDAGVLHLLRLPNAPAGFVSPTIMRNPPWARPFELFARLLGVPSTDEADPSRVVAIIAPIMFGYMFGDVGQGAVILLAGLLLRRRFRALAILVPGGLMSILFGFLFGSVFSLEGLIPALWLHPLEQPFTVLVVSLVFGAGVLILGLTLAALEAHWRQEGGQWLRTRAGLLVAYLSLFVALVEPRALWLTLVGVLWFLAGSLLTATAPRLRRLPTAVAEMGETLFQLAVNTVSFVRVGAFALAHAGLSAAVAGIADAAGAKWGTLLILIVGNVFVILLEGLVVAVQTTRLVLFEFFIRFLTASGRQFRPLPLLDTTPQQGSKQEHGGLE